MSSKFNKDYFESGVATKKSCYENYRWIPELTYPMAFSFVKYLQLKSSSKVLEYGCAHGFLVKALNDFHINTFGVDISSYAINNSPLSIRGKVSTIINSDLEKTLLKMGIDSSFDVVIAKDVFEHIPPKKLDQILTKLSELTKRLFIVVPLGDNGNFRINTYHLDPTHVIAEDEIWWKNKIEANGFRLVDSRYKIKGIKDKWYNVHKKGNGFFLAQSLYGNHNGK
jgi:predicted TPR repeat methyltransferase